MTIKSGLIVLYTGAGIAGLVTLLCIIGWPKMSPVVSYIFWGLALVLLITGAVIDKVQENYCCNNRYAQIFNTPMNAVRDPDDPNPEKDFKERVKDSYKRNQYDRYGARRNKVSQQYRYTY